MNSTTINCILFVVITYLLTCIVAWSVPTQYVSPPVMFVPAIVAIGLTIYNKEKVRNLFKLSSLRTCFLGFIIPIVTLYVVYFGIYLLIEYLLDLPREVEWTLEKVKDVNIAMLLFGLSMSFVVYIVFCLGEEIGWRSYLLKNLKSQIPNFYVRALVVGFIWAIWHMPIWYVMGPMLWEDGFTFTLSCAYIPMVCVFSIVFTWLFEKDNSVWPVTIFHATLDYIVQVIPSVFTTFSLPASNYISALSMILMAISYLIIGVGIIWFDKTRGRRLSDS